MTHVLLAVSCLLRRADGFDVIGAALRLKATGQGHRPIARELGRPASTVRGWLRRYDSMLWMQDLKEGVAYLPD